MVIARLWSMLKAYWNATVGIRYFCISKREKCPKWDDWSSIAYAETLSPDYQNLLNSWPNTGILLGAPSGGLCAIDLDNAAALEAFLQLNPAFRTTLRTHGAQLWVYIDGERPRQVHHLKVDKDSPLAVGCKEPKPDKNGKISRHRFIGEFRAEGGQSVICGIHPDGCDYTWPVANPPITVRFDQIRWPDDIVLPWRLERKDANANNGLTDNGLLKRAVAALPIPVLWNHFGYGERTSNPTNSPFWVDVHPSFSIFNDDEKWKDHGTGDGGDSYDFFQRATDRDSREAFAPFVELAGFGAELRRNRTKDGGNEKAHQNQASGSADFHGSNGDQASAQPDGKRQKPNLILPSGNVTFSDTARAMFPTLANLSFAVSTRQMM